MSRLETDGEPIDPSFPLEGTLTLSEVADHWSAENCLPQLRERRYARLLAAYWADEFVAKPVTREKMLRSIVMAMGSDDHYVILPPGTTDRWRKQELPDSGVRIDLRPVLFLPIDDRLRDINQEDNKVWTAEQFADAFKVIEDEMQKLTNNSGADSPWSKYPQLCLPLLSTLEISRQDFLDWQRRMQIPESNFWRQQPVMTAHAPPSNAKAPTLEAAVNARVAKGEVPGSTVTWKRFCESVVDDANGWIGDKKQNQRRNGFSDKTIQRLVGRT